MTAYPTLTIRVDVVTRAILAQEGITLQSEIHRYSQSYDGYECNDSTLVRLDDFAPPELKRTTSDTYMAIHAYRRCDEVTVYGPDQRADGSWRDPLVMVHGIHLGETVGTAAVGRPLRDLIETTHPVLARLADHPVSAVVDGDARPTGGEAFCHIQLDPDWRTETVHMGRRAA